MAQIIDWKATNKKGTAQNALFHGITLEVGPLLANGNVPWSGTDFIRDAHIEEVEPNLSSARRAAEDWARKQAELPSPGSTPKATTRQQTIAEKLASCASSPDESMVGCSIGQLREADAAAGLLEAKLKAARIAFIDLGSMVAREHWKAIAVRHGYTSERAHEVHEALRAQEKMVDELFDLTMADVEMSEAARAKLLAVHRGAEQK